MARTFVCFFALFILSIAVRFGDCENNNTECHDENIIPGSDETRLSKLEAILKGLISPIDKLFRKNLKLRELITRFNQNPQTKIIFGDVIEEISDDIHIVYPGTHWCGNGDIARDKDDLGFFKRADACCREHDNCTNFISGGETKINLKNNGLFTRSACICERQFYNCLKNSKSPIAPRLGFSYFSILRQQCFECMCPKEDCNLEDGTECINHCKKYRWVDNKLFYKLNK